MTLVTPAWLVVMAPGGWEGAELPALVRTVHCRRSMDPPWNPWLPWLPSPAPRAAEPSTPILGPG